MTTSRILQPAIARAYRAALAAIVVASFAVILAGAARAQDAGAQNVSASDAIPAAAASPNWMAEPCGCVVKFCAPTGRNT